MAEQVTLVTCPHCYNGYTTPRGSRKCATCGGDGYIIPGRKKQVVLDPMPAVEEYDERHQQSHLARIANRLEAGLCIKCGKEPLITKTLGARCAEATRTAAKQSRQTKSESLIG